MTKEQQKAIDHFEKYGNVHVIAPRRSGKTFMCQEYIKNNPDKDFGIVTYSRRIFEILYEYLPNAYYIDRRDGKVDIYIGDEIQPPDHKPYIWVETPPAFIWKLSDFIIPYDKETLSERKEMMDPTSYRFEFGNYEN